MKLTINSQIIIEEPSQAIKDYCKTNLTIKNPEIQKKQAMGFWTGNISKYIKMYSINGDKYILPMGCIDDIWQMRDDCEYKIDLKDHLKLDFPKSNITLYDYQEQAVNEMITHKRGILESKCGSGKSIMGLEIIRRIGYKALIICEKKEIQNQFKDYLENNFGMKQSDYGLIKEGKVEIGKYITIALRQTMANMDLLQYKNEWGTIIVDECQNVGGSVTKATQYSKILNNLASQYRIGLSATGYRVDRINTMLIRSYE